MSDAELRARRAAGYESARPDVLAHVPRAATNVLELGCSSGAFAATLKARQPASVLGVELDSGYADIARQHLDRVIVSDAESFVSGPVPPEAPFDCLVVADVLEHLPDPWTTLTLAAAWLAPGSTVVVSLPNVLWQRGLRRILIDKQWPRDDEGVFDRTHLRWFTPSDGRDLLVAAGLDPVRYDQRFWAEGRKLQLLELLARTPLRPFLAPQQIWVGIKPT